MNIDIAVGFRSSFDSPVFPGFDMGGVRISIDGTILTQFKNSHSDFARYDATGEPLDTPDEYIGEYLSFTLDELKEAVIRFQNNEFDRYEEIPARIVEEPGFSRVVLSFCDGEHARIAFQPKSACYGEYFSTEVTVGYAIDPNEMCHELVGCYEDCITFAENAFGDNEEWNEEMENVYNCINGLIDELLAATDD
jgi:hypothetical protein